VAGLFHQNRVATITIAGTLHAPSPLQATGPQSHSTPRLVSDQPDVFGYQPAAEHEMLNNQQTQQCQQTGGRDVNVLGQDTSDVCIYQSRQCVLLQVLIVYL
jgi:hypothetical protein